MNEHYNLWEETWIDIRNTRESVGILDLLLNAHTYADLDEPNPLFKFGVYRFLIALVMDMYKLQSLGLVKQMIIRGRLPEEVIMDYYDKWGNKFYLFSDDEPFYQNAALAHIDATKSISYLIPQFPSKSNPALHLNLFDDEHVICPEICARALISYPPFAIGFGTSHFNSDGKRVSYTSGLDKTPAYYYLLKGKNLFESLLLNCYADEIEANTGNAPPTWRCDEVNFEAEFRELSLLQAFTWLPRQVLLIPEFSEGECTYSGTHSDILVSQIKFLQGQKISSSCTWTDPNVSYFKRSKRKPLKPSINKPIFRLIPRIFSSAQMDSVLNMEALEELDISSRVYFPPLITEQYKRLHRELEEILPNGKMRIEIFGLVVDKGRAAKLLDLVYETYYLPIDSTDPQAQLMSNIGYIIKLFELILRRIVSGDFKPYKDLVVHTYLRRIQLKYSKLLHSNDPTFTNKMFDFSSSLSEWVQTVKSVAVETFREILANRIRSTTKIRKIIRMERIFYGLSNKILNIPEKETILTEE